MSRAGKTGSAAVLSDEQVRIVLKTTMGSGSIHATRNYLVIVLSNLCGLRSRELASLRVIDVWVGGKVVDVLRLTGNYSKRKKYRDIPLVNRQVVSAIERHIHNQSEVRSRFVEPSGPFSPNSMGHLIKRIYEDAGFRNVSSHSGPKKFATALIEQGADINCVKLLMGHSSAQTTALYFSPSPKRLANLLGSLQMWLDIMFEMGLVNDGIEYADPRRIGNGLDLGS